VARQSRIHGDRWVWTELDAELIHMDPLLLQRRVAALETAFRQIARTRMAGVPILHPRLAVQALGFEPESGENGAASMALGVLITPWFMNLVRLPLQAEAEDELPLPGLGAAHAVGSWRFDFFGGHEDGLGRYAAASLFSPMAEFVDQAAAVATAREVLQQLRAAAVPTTAAAAAGTAAGTDATVATAAVPSMAVPSPRPPVAAPVAVEAVPARRGFLFGRSATTGGRA
jgi:[NiFe] hydrogenase assembly HybE family chaperone